MHHKRERDVQCFREEIVPFLDGVVSLFPFVQVRRRTSSSSSPCFSLSLSQKREKRETTYIIGPPLVAHIYATKQQRDFWLFDPEKRDEEKREKHTNQNHARRIMPTPRLLFLLVFGRRRRLLRGHRRERRYMCISFFFFFWCVLFFICIERKRKRSRNEELRFSFLRLFWSENSSLFFFWNFYWTQVFRVYTKP